MKLVNNAKQCWRWLSVQIPALNIAFLGTWSVLPAKLQDAPPMPWVIGIAASEKSKASQPRRPSPTVRH
jgi:hypothetical protein